MCQGELLFQNSPNDDVIIIIGKSHVYECIYMHVHHNTSWDEKNKIINTTHVRIISSCFF